MTKIIIGNDLPDPFMDSYKQEGLVLADILEIAHVSDQEYVSLNINKAFLKKIVHTYLLHIRELEKDCQGRKYAN